MSLILYRAQDFLVRFVKTEASSICVVTFSFLTDDPCLERPGFGEVTLKKHGIDAVHVINRTNVWYQYPELPAALQIIASATASYERIITYGSSMGGYAAIRFARAVGAGTVIAISPQYSASPRIVPFETRWRALTRNIQFIHEPYCGCGRLLPIVFYDSRDLDAEHFRLIAEAYPRTVGVRLPHAGHPAGAFLNETGLLGTAIREIAFARFDPSALERAARARRRSSGQYLFTLARRLSPLHFNIKVKLAEMSTRATDDAAYRIYLAGLNETTGNFALTERQLKKATCILKDHPVPIRALCAFLLRRGRFYDALPLARELIAIDPLQEDFALLLLTANLGVRDFEAAATMSGALVPKFVLHALIAAVLGPRILRAFRTLNFAWLMRRIRLRKELDRLEEYKRRQPAPSGWRRLTASLKLSRSCSRPIN